MMQPPTCCSGAHKRWQPRQGGCPTSRGPFQGPLGKQGQLGPGHRMSSQTQGCFMPAHHSNQSGSGVRTSLQFLSAFYLVTPVVNPKLHLAHLPGRHLASTCVSDKEENQLFFAVIYFKGWSHPLLSHASFKYLKHPLFNIHISNWLPSFLCYSFILPFLKLH